MNKKRKGGPQTQLLDAALLKQFRAIYTEYIDKNTQKDFIAECRGIGHAISHDLINDLMEGRIDAKRFVSPGTIYKLGKIIETFKQVA